MLKEFTHLDQCYYYYNQFMPNVEFPTLINWTNTVGMKGCLVISFDFIQNKVHFVSKQCRTHDLHLI